LEHKEVDSDPVEWYKSKFDKPPDYSELIAALADTQAERSMLLRPYFEPTGEEREEGLKIPTRAHHAIAELIEAGYIKVIVTTNFDRLLEQALGDRNIIPQVLSTSDEILGAIPVIHSPITILKVNGDYLDTRIKNTLGELESYDVALVKMLDRIFDEFGLIICGWSGTWDVALSDAIRRSPNRRFTTYITHLSEVSKVIKELIELRRAKTIKIEDADSFFTTLAEKVQAIEDYEQPHPMSKEIAVARLKKYIVKDKFRIKLYDFVFSEVTQTLVQKIAVEHFPVTNNNEYENIDEEIIRRKSLYESYVDMLLAILIHGSFWDKEKYHELWLKSIKNVIEIYNQLRSGSNQLIDFNYYPGLLLYYGVGISSIASGNYKNILEVMLGIDIKVLAVEGKIVRFLYPEYIMPTKTQKLIEGYENQINPFNYYLFDYLRPYFVNLIPLDSDYELTFEKFEALSALIAGDLNNKEWKQSFAGPIIRAGWRRPIKPERNIWKIILDEANEYGHDWEFFKYGLFDNSLDRLQKVIKGYIKNQQERTPF